MPIRGLTKSLLLTALLSALAGISEAQAASRGFFAAKPVPGATEEFAKKILTADFNGDGKPDFATLHWENDNRAIVNGVNYEKGFLVRVYLNTTPPGSRDSSFQLSAELPYIHSEYRMYDAWENDMTLDDVNGDGITDIFVANAHNDVILTYVGIADPMTKKGTGQFNLPVETVVDDDPTYIVSGHFATSSGLKQLYIQHYKRNDWVSGEFNILSSLYQFNSNGSLTKIGKTLDDSNKNFDLYNGPYYCFYGNNFITAVEKNSLVFPKMQSALPIASDGKDIVLQNNGADGDPLWAHSLIAGNLIGKEWNDINKPTEVNDYIDGINAASFFGPVPFEHYASFYSSASHVLSGGHIIKVYQPNKSSWVESSYDLSADQFFSAGLLTKFEKITPKYNYYGSAFLLEDLDKDGQLDLLALSDEGYAGIKSYSERKSIRHNIEQSILVAYGTSPDQHPLNVDPTVGFDTDRIKLLTNASGRWYAGLHDWHWALDDFNGDGYKDLITLTDNGIMVHTNYGNFAQEAVPPVLNDMSINTIKPGATITVNGNFRTGDRLANWIELTDRTMMGRPNVKYLLSADPTSVPKKITDPFTQMSVLIPADKIRPGTYELRVTNTLARSTRFLTLIVQ